MREAARRRGLLLRASHWMAVLAPPLTITADELDELLDILEEALSEVLSLVAASAPLDARDGTQRAADRRQRRADPASTRTACSASRATPRRRSPSSYGTPLFVTSEAQIRANVRRLRDAFEERWPRVTLLYATKANANLAVRRILVDEGVGGDCFGLGELTVSLRAGVAPERLVLNGSNKQPPELRAAIEAGVTINVDDPTELDAVDGLAQELGRPASICLRVLPFSYADPGSLEPDLAAIAADTSHDKWGMDRATLLEVVPRALASDSAPPARPAPARQPAPPHAGGLRARRRA